MRCRIPPDSLSSGSVTRELHDLQTDPGEGRNLITSSNDNYQKLVQDLEQKLDSWINNAIAARPTS